jgi:tetratricopeptide (TPR) repeat protein
MRKTLIALALIAVSLPAWAQMNNADIDRCSNGDPDIKIIACTALIQSGRQTPANLAVAYFNRAAIYIDKSRYDEAMADFTNVIALDPDDAFAYGGRGYTYSAKSLFDEAIADYTKAIALKPDYANAYNNRAFAYEKKNERDKAISDYRTALKLGLDPDSESDTNKSLARLLP